MLKGKSLLKRMIGIMGAAAALAAVELPAQTVTGYSHNPPADYVHSNLRFGNYPGGYFTPRIEWARPYATGQLKILAFLPLTAARESVELASRLDAQVDIVTPTSHDTWYSGGEGGFYSSIPSLEELNGRATLLLSPAYRHHAIVIGKLKWSVIPADIRNRILAKVKAGAALVFVTPWDVEADLLNAIQLDDGKSALAGTIAATVPLDALNLHADLTAAYPGFPPRSIGPTVIRTGKLDEGRVVVLDYNDLWLKDGKKPAITFPWRELTQTAGLTPFAEDDDLFYDYYYSILAKALVHAAGRESGVSLRPDTVTVAVGREKLPAAPVTFTASFNGRIGEGASIGYEIRNRRNVVIAKGGREITETDGTVTVAPQMPAVQQGLYIADVWLKRRGAVQDWASAAVTVSDTSYLKAVTTDKDFFGRDEAIRGRLSFNAPVPSRHSVAVELWDTWNRLEQSVELKPGAETFSFSKIEHPLSRIYRVVAKVKSGDAVMDERETSVGLPSNQLDDFQFLVWYGAVNDRPGKTAMRLFKDLGVTAYDHGIYYYNQYLMRHCADFLARNDLHAWAYASGLVGFRIDGEFGDWEKGVYWGKPAIHRQYTMVCEAYRRYGALAYCVDSEGSVSRDDKLWDNPTAKKDFSLYLKERYGDIARLNAVWGSAFKDFDEIGFISFMDAKTGRKYTQWLETNLYKSDRYNRVPEYQAKFIRELDPGARVALSITFEDYDLPRMAKVIDGFTQSGLEDFDKDKFRLAGTYFGYYQGTLSEWHMRVFPWERLFRGDNQVNWWTGLWSLTYDISEPTLGFKQTSEEILEIQKGPGKLLMASAKRVDPILILRSTPSRFAAILHPPEIGWDHARDNFTNMLRRTGLDYQFVGDEFLETGLEFGARQRVLILPACQAVSLKGVEKIKAFAQAGGLVMADFMPAVVDEYLRPYGETRKAAQGEPKFETCPKCQGKKIIHLGGTGNPLGPCPRCGGTGLVAQGEARPQTSMLADLFDFSAKGAKPYGKGYGFFLKGAPVRDEWGAMRKNLVAHGGVRDDIRVLDSLGNFRTDLRTYVYDNGGALLVGVAPDSVVAEPPGAVFTLKTAQPRHIYNVRRQAYLGLTDSVTAGIASTEAKLFALLPARIEGLEVKTDKTRYRPGETVSLDIGILPAALKDVSLAVRFEVLAAGRSLPEHARNLTVKGTLRHYLPLALNQENGEYVLRLTEVVSGHRQEVKVQVGK